MNRTDEWAALRAEHPLLPVDELVELVGEDPEGDAAYDRHVELERWG